MRGLVHVGQHGPTRRLVALQGASERTVGAFAVVLGAQDADEVRVGRDEAEQADGARRLPALGVDTLHQVRVELVDVRGKVPVHGQVPISSELRKRAFGGVELDSRRWRCL